MNIPRDTAHFSNDEHRLLDVYLDASRETAGAVTEMLEKADARADVTAFIERSYDCFNRINGKKEDIFIAIMADWVCELLNEMGALTEEGVTDHLMPLEVALSEASCMP